MSSNAYDLVIDLLPRNTPEEIDAVRRLVNREPDSALLREMLGLDPIILEPKQEQKVVQYRGWCDLHNMGKEVRADGGARCRKCSNMKRSERRRRGDSDRGEAA